MKRTLLSLITVLAVVAAAAGATFAYFADEAESIGNSFTTGEVQIGVGETFDIEEMFPGSGPYTDAKTITNNGTLPFEYSIWASLSEGSEALYGELHLEIWDQDFGNKYYDGLLSNLSPEIFDPRGLDKDESEVLQFQVDLPETGEEQNDLQDQNATVTFTFEARTESGFVEEIK